MARVDTFTRKMTEQVELLMRDAALDHIAEHIGPDFLKALGKFVNENPHLGQITVADLVKHRSPRRGKNGKSQIKPDKVKRYDASVLMTIRSLDEGKGVSAESIREKVGGTPAELRRSTKRLRDAKKITRKGQRRATRYQIRR